MTVLLDKTCGTCGESKPRSEFYKHSTNRDGLQGECKPCHLVRGKKWAADNRERTIQHQKDYRERLDPEVAAERLRRYNYKQAYGITIEQYDEMFEAQHGLCAICSEPPKRMRLSVDHNAETGIVRQLLCSRCNTAIGLLREDPAIMAAAIAYIERHNQ